MLSKKLSTNAGLTSMMITLCIIPVSAIATSDTPTTIKYEPQTFEAEFWRPYHALHALDIINHIPGFTLINTQPQRGLSNSTGNILVNGIPLLSKNTSLSTLLSQLNERQIQHVDLYNNGHSFSAASQYNQLINIVTHQSVKQTTLRATATHQADKLFNEEIALQMTMPVLNWVHQLDFSHNKDTYHSTAKIIELDKLENKQEHSKEWFLEKYKNNKINTLSKMKGDHNTIQVTTAYEKSTLSDSTQYAAFSEKITQFTPRNIAEIFLDNNNQKQLELAIDWQHHGFKDKQIHSTVFLKKTTEHTRSSSHHIDKLSTVQTEFDQGTKLNEFAAKVALTQPHHWLSPEFGIAASRNTLQAHTLSKNNGNPLSHLSEVEENRLEPYVSFSTHLLSNWQLFTRINTEFSHLSTYGHNPAELKKFYIKPLIRLSYEIGNTLTIATTAQRQVQQLDFSPFIDSENVSFARSISGNLQLQPMKYNELAVNLTFSPDDIFNVNMRTFYQRQHNIHEYIQLDQQSVGLGNAGAADYYGIDTELSIKDLSILPNVRFELSHAYRDASFNDPLTKKRHTTDLIPHQMMCSFQHTINNLNWGMRYISDNTYTEFYYDEIYTERIAHSLALFSELKISQSTQFSLNITSINGEKTQFQRQFFTSNRAGIHNSTSTYNDTASPRISLSVQSLW